MDITVKDLFAKKRALEHTLFHQLQAAIEQFYVETGISVEEVNVEMRHLSTVTGATRYLVDSVKVTPSLRGY